VLIDIPKAKVFRFENYWMNHEEFMQILQHGLFVPVPHSDKARKLMGKFKNLRRVLRLWHSKLSNLAATITSNKLVLQFLDILEEFRDLSLEEWNFRALVQENLKKLLENQRIYWMQRDRIKCVTLGDENTKFIHANATVRHNKNSIMSLKGADGLEKFSHEDKANILWDAYKDRLGTKEFTHMYFDLSSLLNRVDNLDDLALPFSKDEIDDVIRGLPIGKSPGPDGFNTDFIKKYWPVISEDFNELCLAFYNKEICLQSINGSYITLIPKIDNPITASDFRPISLLNSSIKLITKILENRLQAIIFQLIHQNQYGFIKSRSIQDCLAWSFEYLHLCHQSRKELVILKLDFEKAFDKIEYEVITLVMRQKGFLERWIDCIAGILSSGTSAVLLNGVPRKVFHCHRGVRQGDPLSPFLFVLRADLLQSVVNEAMQTRLLRLPINVGYTSDFP
jgi:hypothetical protein